MLSLSQGYQQLETDDSIDIPKNEGERRDSSSRSAGCPIQRIFTQCSSIQKKRLKLWLLGTCILLCGGFWILVYTRQDSVIRPKWKRFHRYFLSKYTGDRFAGPSLSHQLDHVKLNSTFQFMIEKYKVHNSTCTNPVNKVGFCKTHKTASSALQNILFRYGKENNWTFAFYDEGSQLGPPHNQYLLSEQFTSSWLDLVSWRPMVKEQGYNTFAVHAMWSKPEVKKLLGKGAAYITILRNPVDQFESMYSYMRFQKELNMTLDQFVNNVIKNDVPVKRVNSYLGRDQQLWDLGRRPRDTQTEEQVINVIKEIEKEFDLVLISEDMDSSLVLLSQVLCWPINHFTTLMVNTRKKSVQIPMSQEMREAVRDWLWPDVMLYTYFRQVLDKKKNNFGKQALDSKVNELRKMNEQIQEVCVEGISKQNNDLSTEFKPWTDDVIGYKINQTVPWCKYYGMVENRFIDLLRETQRSRFQDWRLTQPEEE